MPPPQSHGIYRAEEVAHAPNENLYASPILVSLRPFEKNS
jgi:hypothetical protein